MRRDTEYMNLHVKFKVKNISGTELREVELRSKASDALKDVITNAIKNYLDSGSLISETIAGVYVDTIFTVEDPIPISKTPQTPDLLKMQTIVFLGGTTAARRASWKAETIGDLIKLTKWDLGLKPSACGDKSIKEIREKLQAQGLDLKQIKK